MQIKQTRKRQSTARARQKVRTQKRVLDAARDLFSEHGFFGTRASDIAKAAGVSHGTVFSEYGSKGGLIAAILDSLMADRIAFLKKVGEDAQAADWPAARKFDALLRALWNEDQKNRRLIQAYLSYSYVWDDESEAAYNRRLSQTLNVFIEALEDGAVLDIPEGGTSARERMEILSAVYSHAFRAIRYGGEAQHQANVVSAARFLFPFKDGARA